MKARIQLDWTRLLGFDQAPRKRDVGFAEKAEFGARIAAKSGIKPAVALGDRIGAKMGSKPGFKPMA